MRGKLHRGFLELETERSERADLRVICAEINGKGEKQKIWVVS